jgi:arylsulfatase A-like enzyme
VIRFRVIFAVFAAAFSCGSRDAWAADKPNIVIILADDLGNADLGYRGSKIKTPNIDILAKGGVRLESYYGLPLCTPARAALLTGRYPMRHGLQTLVIFPSHKYGLPADEKTLPQALKEIGYSTYMVGKWHLGHADKKYWPNSRGFDHFYGNVVGEVDYFTKDRGGVIDWQRNGTFLKEDGYYTTQIGDEAVGLIEKHDKAKPMFLYEEREASGGVALGSTPPATNTPFTGGKGGLHEGGVRLPAIVNLPAKLQPAVVNEPLHHVDVMPTLLALAGGTGDPAKPFDGKDAMATIGEGKPSLHENKAGDSEEVTGSLWVATLFPRERLTEQNAAADGGGM